LLLEEIIHAMETTVHEILKGPAKDLRETYLHTRTAGEPNGEESVARNQESGIRTQESEIKSQEHEA